MMTDEQILQKIRSIARSVFDDDQVDFNLDTPFRTIEEWDSLSHMHMVVRMETAFGIRFQNNELNSLVIIRDLVSIIESKLPS